jgi:hypothetical protein
MTDRELLELAAKAAGLHDQWPEPDYGAEWQSDEIGIWCFGNGEGVAWNPLTDDGDALRLAVRMNLWAAVRDGYQHFDSDNDHYEATRRAIVRAAACIGSAL